MLIQFVADQAELLNESGVYETLFLPHRLQ